MFGTVEFYERENTVKGRIKSVFFRQGISAERVTLPDNEYFYRFRVPLHKGKIPTEKLRKLTASVNDGLIFPPSFTNDGSLKEYSSTYFPDIVLFNSAVSQIKKSVSDPAGTLITLIDRKGLLHSRISCLIPFAGELKVITDNIRAYEREAERLMRDYGLTLFISDRLSSIPESGIIISRCSDVIPVYFKGLLITEERRLLPFATVLRGEGIRGVGSYEALCPEGIDMTKFLSALCEVCFVKELRESEYEKLVDISL